MEHVLAPTLDEAAAVMAAVDTYGKKLHPRKPRMVKDMSRLLRELRESIERLEAVTHPKEDA